MVAEFVTDQFRVNTTLKGYQQIPKIAANADGRFLISFEDYSESGGSGADMRGRAYDPLPKALTDSDFIINTKRPVTSGVPFDLSQSRGVVTALADDGFAAAWIDNRNTANGGLRAEVHVQLYDADLAGFATDLRVDTSGVGRWSPYFSDNFFPVDLAGLRGGNVAVAWANEPQSGVVAPKVVIRVLSASGTPVTGELPVEVSGLGGRQVSPKVIALSKGGFAVTWQQSTPSAGVESDGSSIAAQIFAANGTKLGTAFQVNATTVGNQIAPRGAALADGGFVIAWVDPNGSNSSAAIRAQRFDDTGHKVGAEILVLDDGSGGAGGIAPRVFDIVALPEGGFAVLYDNDVRNQPDLGLDSFVQLVDANGVRHGAPVTINATGLAPDDGQPLNKASQGGGGLAYLGNGVFAATFADLSVFTDADTSTATRARLVRLSVKDQFVTGDDGKDKLLGKGMSEAIYGLAGNDKINAGKGADFVLGGEGKDKIAGAGGDDRLDGGAGRDSLAGGKGNDQFVFAPGCGKDVIADFKAGSGKGDVIIFHGFAVSDFDAVVDRASLNPKGHVVIDLDDGDSVTLSGVRKVKHLGEDDFILA